VPEAPPDVAPPEVAPPLAAAPPDTLLLPLVASAPPEVVPPKLVAPPLAFAPSEGGELQAQRTAIAASGTLQRSMNLIGCASEYIGSGTGSTFGSFPERARPKPHWKTSAGRALAVAIAPQILRLEE